MKKYFIALAISLFLFVDNSYALTKAPIDVTSMSILEILDSMEKGYIDSETLVKIYLERIEAYDNMFNSINQLNGNALQQAIELDNERDNGKLRGKLHGIPILVKCNIDVYGMPTTAGTKSLIDNYPKENAFVVQKLIDEGAIILGSTNMSELAFSAANSYSSYGYVKNIFNVNYTSYGSSGGSAVAVGASFALASLGTDTNSSVRLPAAGAGLVGIRPTMGLVSRNGVIPYDIERDTVGVISKNVSDSALLLSVISGYDKEDEVTENSISKNYEFGNLEGITIGVPIQYVKGSSNGSGVTGLTDNDIYNLTLESITKLEEAGATIIYVDDFVKKSNLRIAANTVAGSTMCDNFDEYILGTTGTIRNFKHLSSSKGHVQRLSGYVKGCGKSQNLRNYRDSKKEIYRNYVEEYMEEYNLDVILYPTLKNKVFQFDGYGNVSPGSSLGSVIGFPSITVPMGYIDEFSYGIEFLAKAYNEDVLYNVASNFEKINNNKIVISNLVPSLYEVPTEVTKLKMLYEDNISKKDDLIKGWKNEVILFFEKYNEIGNVKEEALLLIESFYKLDVNGSKVINIHFDIVVTMICLFAIAIIIKELFNCLKVVL